MTDIIYYVILYTLFLFITIAAHELGHYIMLLRFGARPKFIWYNGNPAVKTETKLNRDDRQAVILEGVLWGYAAIGLISILLPHFFISLVIVYTFGCLKDLKRLNKIKWSGTNEELI